MFLSFLAILIDNIAVNIVNDPTLPKNIKIIIMNLPTTFKLGLPPILSPTVAYADITSNTHSISEN